MDILQAQFATIQRLQEGIKELCPSSAIDSKFGNSESVKFVPDSAATKQQIADAQAYIDAFDWRDEAATQAFLDAKEPNLDVLKKQASQMVADIDAFVAVADKAEIAELRAEAIASALRQKTLIQAVERLAGK